MDSPFDGALNKARLFKHFQMLRNRWLSGSELAAELARTSGLAPRERINH
jgi:hypothetical protein